MLYRRSPRCTSCYHVGHTRRSCPTIKEKAAIASAKTYEERSYDEKRAVETVLHYKEQVKERVCAYCTGSGHNIAGCKERKQDIITVTNRLVSWRKDLLAKCKVVGLGVGAMLTTESYNYRTEIIQKNYFIAVRFFAENLVYWRQSSEDGGNCEKAIIVRNIGSFDMKGDNNTNAYEELVALPNELITLMNPNVDLDRRYYKSCIESPVTTNINFGIPDDEFVSLKACSERAVDIFNHTQNSGANKRKYSQKTLRNSKILI